MNTQQSLTIGSRRVEREHTPAYARAMQWVLCMHAIHDPHLHDDGDDDGDGDDNDGNNDDDDVPTSTTRAWYMHQVCNHHEWMYSSGSSGRSGGGSMAYLGLARDFVFVCYDLFV